MATRLGAPGRHALAAVGQAANSLPIWSCSVWGLPCPRLHSRGGALLPHLFTLTLRLRGWRYIFCGTGRLPALKPESRTLSGTLPCGVRTFLSRGACATRQRPSSSPAGLILSQVSGEGSRVLLSFRGKFRRIRMATHVSEARRGAPELHPDSKPIVWRDILTSPNGSLRALPCSDRAAEACI